MNIRFNLDTVKYSAKPSNKDFEDKNGIRYRLPKRRGEYSPETLIEAITQGQTFSQAEMTGTDGSSWKSQQIIVADIDNDIKVNGKKVLIDNYLTPSHALDVMNRYGIKPYVMYYTFSNKEGFPRFRIVLILEEPLSDSLKALDLMRRFIGVFNRETMKTPDKFDKKNQTCADTSTADLARVVFGSTRDCIIKEGSTHQFTSVSLLEALPEPPKGYKKPQPKRKPVPTSNLSDLELIEKARENETTGAEFSKLWDIGSTGDHSAEDYSLCRILAFWTGGDKSRIDNLFRQSKLYRDKWEREDYKARTIQAAIDSLSSFYPPGASRTVSKDFLKYDDTINESNHPSQAPGSTQAAEVETTSGDTPRASEHPLQRFYDVIDKCYISQDNRLMCKSEKGDYPLCYGVLAIESEVTKNNGVDNEIFFKILASNINGELLHPCYVSASEFNSLSWVMKNYGARLALSPQPSAKQYLATAITLTGLNCERRKVFSHFGYIYDKDGKPKDYLHFGGDLLADDSTQCELDSNLKRYDMTLPGTEEENRAAVLASFKLLEAHAPEVTYPLFAFCYLPALIPVISEVVGDTGFCMFLQGKTQSGKSTLAALATSFFGKFTSTTPPASFLATANAINELAFILKDSIFWVDDFHPQGTQKDKKRLDSIFQSIARAAGDKSTRARLNANSTLKKNHPPRCLFLVTGEDKPDIGQSGQARVFTLNVKDSRRDIRELQAAASSGELSRANACYISHIINHYEDVKQEFKKIFNRCIEEVTEVFGEYRLTTQTALLITSLHMFLEFACDDNGFITREEGKRISEEGLKYIVEAARGIEDNIKNSDPVNIYVKSLRDLIITGRVRLTNTKDNFRVDTTLDDFTHKIGFIDDTFIYLNPNLAYKEVSSYQTAVNQFFSISQQTIQRELMERGFIFGYKGSPTSPKTIAGKSFRFLKFKRETLMKESSEPSEDGSAAEGVAYEITTEEHNNPN